MKKAPLTTKTRGRNRPQAGGNDFDTGELLSALIAFKRGDFSARFPDDWVGVPGKIADTFNAIIEINQRMTRELERIRRVVGEEGRITQRASIGEVTNSRADAVGSINNLIGDLVQPTSEMARVIGAVAKGDLSQTMAIEIEGRALKGEFLHTSAASRIKSLRQSHQLPSGNDSKREIVAVASRVAGLQVVTIHRHDRTIRQVAERAADGISARVTDQSQS